MTISKKFRPAIFAAGCLVALAVAASPASAQSGAQAGSIAIKAGKDGSKTGRVSASILLPAGASVGGKVLLGKRVLCVAARKKANTDGTPTEIGCRFPLRALAAKKARTSQNGQYAPYVVLNLLVWDALTMEGVDFPPGMPIVMTVPIAIASFEKTYG
ncbi:MAG: hypothetical protein ACKOTA_06050 [Solirubrobacterales bacterium]